MPLNTYPIYKTGSVKNIRGPLISASSREWIFEFSDDYSVFDWGKMPDTIPEKGDALLQLSLECFKILHTHGIKTHWTGVLFKDGTISRDLAGPFTNAAGMIVNALDVIPLEVVFRFELRGASSFLKRNPDSPLKAGHKFETPVIEFFTKREPIDRFLTDSQAIEVSGLTPARIEEVKKQTQVVAAILKNEFATRGMNLVDGKFEWGLNAQGELILVDAIGPDELRIEKEGRSLSKEVLREFYRKTEWFNLIEEYKKNNQLSEGWQSTLKVQPPMLPLTMIQEMAAMYQSLALSFASNAVVILLGSGGREHALAAKLLESAEVKKLIWAPGLDAAAQHLQSFYKDKIIETWPEVKMTADASITLARHAKKSGVTFAVIGPDQALAEGFTDALSELGIPTFGPTQKASKLEWSKAFAKEIMHAAHVPTASSYICKNKDEALETLKKLPWSHDKQWVLKADGLALGKGVEVCETLAQALAALQRLSAFGSQILIEERLFGQEISWLAFCDGETAALLDPARDYKTLNEEQKGPNTGGMGAISPVPGISENLRLKVREQVFLPVLKEMKKRGITYRGLLYAGLMIHSDQFWVLEFNARFGDPETQALLPRLKGDLLVWLKACVNGTLDQLPLNVPFEPTYSVYIVGSSPGYPEKPLAGKPLLQIEAFFKEKSFGYFSGLKHDGTNWVTSGGRVLGTLGLASSLDEARTIAYHRMSQVHSQTLHYRKDIGGAL
jgi:phosphoribosylamine--glycine ligase